MDTDELRDIIWQHLFHSKRSQSIDELARLTDRDVTVIRAAVNHEWFAVADDHVMIAYVTPASRASS